jgi:hypothetical protein
MKCLIGWLILPPCIGLLCGPATTFGQLRGSLGGGVRGGIGSSAGGIRGGGYGPRYGTGFRNNPIANPAPSLTPHQIFNPRGSISSGQILNPAPSLSRPRSGISTSPVNRTDPFGHHVGRGVRTRSAGITPSGSGGTPPPARARIEQLAAALRQQSTPDTALTKQQRWDLAAHLARLEQELRTYPNGEVWIRYFDLPAAASGRPGKGNGNGKGDESSAQELQQLAERFERVSGNAKYERISSLPEFQSALSALVSYRRKDSRKTAGDKQTAADATPQVGTDE